MAMRESAFESLSLTSRDRKLADAELGCVGRGMDDDERARLSVTHAEDS